MDAADRTKSSRKGLRQECAPKYRPKMWLSAAGALPLSEVGYRWTAWDEKPSHRLSSCRAWATSLSMTPTEGEVGLAHYQYRDGRDCLQEVARVHTPQTPGTLGYWRICSWLTATHWM